MLSTTESADLLMLAGIERPCPDCVADRVLVPVPGEQAEFGEYCCTTCGAAVWVDPAFTYGQPRRTAVA